MCTQQMTVHNTCYDNILLLIITLQLVLDLWDVETLSYLMSLDQESGIDVMSDKNVII